MSIAIILFNIIGTINEAFWMFVLNDKFYKRRRWLNENKYLSNKNLFLLLPIAIYILIVLSFNHIENVSPYTFLAAMLYSVIAVIVLWKSDVVLAVATVGMYGLLLLLKDLCSMLFIRNVLGEDIFNKCAGENGIERLLLLIISNLIWFSVCFAIYKIVGKKVVDLKNIRYLSVICIVSYVGFLFLGSQIINNFFADLNYLFICLLAITVALGVFSYFMIKYKELVYIVGFEQERSELLERNYKIINEHYNSNAKLYHDINNHLNILGRLLEKNQIDEAKDYLSDISKTSNNYSIVEYTKVDIIDIILSDKGNIAVGKEVQYNVKTQILPQDIKLANKDIGALLTNLLDNALEAAEKYINININLVHNMLYIQITNDINQKPKEENGKFITTKKDKINHGWGLKSVEEIVNRYNGIIEYNFDEQQFEVKIMLNVL